MAPITKKKPTPSSKPLKKFVIDYSKPANDGVFDGAAFEKFLHDRFKVDGRPGELGDAVKIHKAGNTIVVSYYVPIAKTYLKYLTKKYLKKNELRDWIRVVASAKDKYELRFYNVEKYVLIPQFAAACVVLVAANADGGLSSVPFRDEEEE